MPCQFLDPSLVVQMVASDVYEVASLNDRYDPRSRTPIVGQNTFLSSSLSRRHLGSRSLDPDETAKNPKSPSHYLL
jgi:hypothetical protein